MCFEIALENKSKIDPKAVCLSTCCVICDPRNTPVMYASAVSYETERLKTREAAYKPWQHGKATSRVSLRLRMV